MGRGFPAQTQTLGRRKKGVQPRIFRGSAADNREEVGSMKTKTIALLAVCVTVALMAAAPLGAGESSIEQGKELFSAKTLGGSTNETSCSSCHPGGKGLEKAGKKSNLGDMINRCIAGPLGGQRVEEASPEMGSLKMYIESLGK